VQRNLLRFLLYALGVTGLTLALLTYAHFFPENMRFNQPVPGFRYGTSEFSPVELLQNVMLLYCALTFVFIAARDRLRRPLAVGLAALFGACLIRELDFFLDLYGVDNLWQVLTAIILSTAVVYIGRHWHRFMQGWRRTWPSAGLALIIGGFIILVPYAQLIGHEPLWQALMGDDYRHVTKVIAEEFIELGAYILITIGTLEFVYAWSRLPRTGVLHDRRRRG
jgi:hypothetical protein